MTIYISKILNADEQLLDAVNVHCKDSFRAFTTDEIYSLSEKAYEEVKELVRLNRNDCTVQLIDTEER